MAAAAHLRNMQQQAGIRLPIELVGNIMQRVPQAPVATEATTSISTSHKAAIPPANGSCPFMKLPAELRRQIFMDSLPERKQHIKPTCGHAPAPTKVQKKGSKARNTLVDLMVLNQTICQELSETVYEERPFEVHVHAGFQNAGVEWLNAGRQPLQYQDETADGRFSRFTLKDVFGFQRVKKIIVSIFPSAINRHAALNTYFMNQALVGLLREGKPGQMDKRMTSVQLRLCYGIHDGVEDLKGRTNHWWDAATNAPRQSSVHGISDVELALRPFAGLIGVSNVEISLPHQLLRHGATKAFTDLLRAHMMNPERVCLMDNDEVGFQIETARIALEDYINKTCFGGRWIDVPKLTDEELADIEDVEIKQRLERMYRLDRKHDHSPENRNPGDAKKKKVVLKLSKPATVVTQPTDDPGIMRWQNFAAHEGRDSSRSTSHSAFEGKGRTLGVQENHTTRHTLTVHEENDVGATEQALIDQAMAESLQDFPPLGTASAPITISDDEDENEVSDGLQNGHAPAEPTDIDIVAQHTNVSHADAQVYLEVFKGNVNQIIETYRREPELLSWMLAATKLFDNEQPGLWSRQSQSQLHGMEDPFVGATPENDARIRYPQGSGQSSVPLAQNNNAPDTSSNNSPSQFGLSKLIYMSSHQP